MFLLLSLSTQGWAVETEEYKAKAIKSLDALVVEHKKLVAEHLSLTAAEAQEFWPIYESYRRELQVLNEERIAYMGDLADKYGAMDDELSLKFIEHFTKIEKGQEAVWERYIPRFIQAIGARKTARFFQIERRIRIYVDAELSRAVPLLK